MIIIYTKYPMKGLRFLEDVASKMKEEGTPYNFRHHNYGYGSSLQTATEEWVIAPATDSSRGMRWTKCYVDADIDETFLQNVVRISKDPKGARWDLPMILI